VLIPLVLGEIAHGLGQHAVEGREELRGSAMDVKKGHTRTGHVDGP
jgi:hypothetical protein